MELPDGQERFDWVEVRFKNGRKEFYHNTNGLTLQVGDVIAVESSPGHDIGGVSIVGELVRIQMSRKRFKYQEPANLKKVYRKANQRDLDLWELARNREQETMFESRKIADGMGLDMKISDVEYQGDGAKATFYYTANGRVDFRQLIRELAGKFNIRVEMRQIGARQEAARLGGIGSCGRELCCSTWLTDFRTVNTAAARYQQLALNPQKLAGQCGKLKCCLNYELDSYLDALKGFPEMQLKLKTQRGEAVFQKKDIFKKILWYAYPDEILNWVPLHLDDVLEIVALNERGEMPASIEVFRENRATPELELANVVGQDDLNRFDTKKRPKRKKRPGQFADEKPTVAAERPVQRPVQPVQNKPANKPAQPQQAAAGTSDNKAVNARNNRRRPPRKNQNKDNRGESN